MQKKPLVIITGSSQGIGLGLAHCFSKAGFALGLLARNIKPIEELNLPNTIAITTDVTDFAALQKSIKKAEETFGPVNGLINNAGFATSGDFTEITHEDHQRMINLNVMGVIHGIESVLPGMQVRKTGTIINISSLADRNARPNMATYAASKAAIKSLSESLRMANAKHGIRICNVAPAKVLTPLSIAVNKNKSDHDMISVEEFCEMIMWIYQQPKHICIRDIVIAPTYYDS